MRTVVITRTLFVDAGTFGGLVVGDFKCQTAELPWKDNKSNISCIPAGTYEGRWTHSPKYKRKMYLVYGDHGRKGIRIHSANWTGDKSKGLKSQVLGCIALGAKRVKIQGQLGVTASKSTCKAFEKYLGGENFTLIIKERL